MAMYGEEGSVHGWNAVDVRVDDHLQHGDVINVAPGGLIIDFRCAKQRALFVEFDRVYHSPHSTQHSFQPEKQALLRRYPDGAWIWYTGRVVNMWRFSSDSAQLLDVELPAGAVRQVVHFHQVRTIPSEADWEELRVGNDDFVIRSCQLPAAFLAEGSELRRELFQCRLNYRYQVVCTSVLSQTVVYLQRQNKAPLTADQVDGIFKQVKKEERRRRPRDTAHLQLVLRQRADVANKPRKTSGGAGAASLPLPAELLVEIFQSLDSIGRVRCRRVCPLWNDILTTEAYFPDVRVSAGHPDYGVLTFAGPGIYWAGACLLRCVSSRTKMVIISSVGLYQCVELTALLGMLLEPVKIPPGGVLRLRVRRGVVRYPGCHGLRCSNVRRGVGVRAGGVEEMRYV
ncbi:uncharacterized protein LOC129596578 [Paramacrobiotus metropolitanus]|uniref:uncharacterized protein LOC129596578 n=1 Tax=Paramacrobiotus metropolitanus TaxID=2943436 RepID=UPI0024456653|nr:uncharacterized protein LOC129596578 [Paramacrobiotus metropolitanus]